MNNMESSVDISSIKSTIETIISAENEQDFKNSLEQFLDQATELYNFTELNSTGIMPSLWSKLYEYLNTENSPELQFSCLDVLRILTRDNTGFQSGLTKERINILLKHANILNDSHSLEDTDYRTVAALRCLYNIIYNSRQGLQIMVDQNLVERILDRADNSDSHLMTQIKLFDMKVLFLVSALCKDVREKMKEKHGIKYLIKKLAYIQDSATISLATPEVDVFCEILKILFNLSLNITDDVEDQESCLHLVKLLRDLLLMAVFNKQSKIDLHNNIVNLLTNMPYSSYEALAPEIEEYEILGDVYKYGKYNMLAVSYLLDFLENRLSKCADKLEELAPILTVLLRSASSVRIIRKYLRLKILPPLRDVRSRPEEGTTVRNKLCRLLTSPTSSASDLTARLLFVLCKENVARMVKHTGYGNAAGLLAQRGLLAGGNSSTAYSSESEDSDTEEYRQHRDNINPVVGCLEPPHPNPIENMSEEQKEHEVIQLVNLMDNLTRKGIVKPCKVGEDGKLQAVEHILELQESLPAQQVRPKNND